MPLSDQAILKLWQKRNKAKKRAADMNKIVKKCDEKILKEFERRGIKSLEFIEDNERITYVQAENIVYIEENLRARLQRSKKGREILKRITKEIMDMRAVASEVQAGNIDAEVVADCSEVRHSAPYLKGSAIE